MLLGFDMQALKKVKHNLNFEESKIVGTSAKKAVGISCRTPKTDQNKHSETLNCTLKLSTCTETISIDSDSETNTDDRPTENGDIDVNAHESFQSKEPLNMTEETKPADNASRETEVSLQDGNASLAVCLG